MDFSVFGANAIDTRAQLTSTTEMGSVVAAKHSKYSQWGLAAIGGGIALTAIEGLWRGIVSGQPGGAELLGRRRRGGHTRCCRPACARRLLGHGRYILSILLWMAMAPALSVIVTAAVERTGSANDGAERGRQGYRSEARAGAGG